MAQVSREQIDTAKASYARCSGHPDFIFAFYRNFFRACPRAEPMFARTDLQRQDRLLRHALGSLLIFPDQPEREPNLLTRVAERHSRRDLNVEPSLYGPFVDSLLSTIRDFDPEYSPAVEQAWRATLAKGVAYMMSKY